MGYIAYACKEQKNMNILVRKHQENGKMGG
jgi:hypothetical protein